MNTDKYRQTVFGGTPCRERGCQPPAMSSVVLPDELNTRLKNSLGEEVIVTEEVGELQRGREAREFH
jgi:hypothetical protein